MKSFHSVSSGGCWCGVEICTSQVVALVLWRGPNPARPVQPGSQPKVVLLPGAPHQILSDTSLQSQKPPPYQRARTRKAKIPDQGKTLMCESAPSELSSLPFSNYWQLAGLSCLNRTKQVSMIVLVQFFLNLLFFFLHSFLFFAAYSK